MDPGQAPSAAAEAGQEQDARQRLAAIPGFSPEEAAKARFTRLVGFTNRVFKVEIGDEVLCLRIPGDGAAALVDRHAEAVNARLAAKAGVAPEVVHFGDDAVMVTRSVEGAVPLLPARVAESEGALQRAAVALRRLHDSRAAFAGPFDAFGFIDSYVAALDRLGTSLSEGRRRIVHAVRSLHEPLSRHAVRTPCHCDPTGRNLLDDGAKVWLVDWEFSAMNDPMWDLAYFSMESRLDWDGDRALAAAYFAGDPPARDMARMAVLKPVCEVVGALWALIQAAEGIHAGDFLGYAERSFASAAARMEASEFEAALGKLRG